MLPNNLFYQTHVESSAARSYRSNIQPQNGTGTYNAGDTITINIPTRQNLVFVPEESVLKFTLTYTSGAANNIIRLDSCGAHGVIERIRVWHGSNLLSDLSAYGNVAKMLFDLQVPTDAAYGKHTILSGTRSDLCVTFPQLIAGDFTGALVSGIKLSARQANSGVRISGPGVLAANATASGTFSLSLISLCGTLGASKYFPLFECTSAPLRLEITLASSALATAACNVATTFKITNCEYIAQMIELNDSAMNIIRQSQNGRPLQYVFPDYRNYQFTTSLAAAATTTTFAINAKFSSLKSIFVTQRDNAQIATLTYFPFSCNKFSMTSYYFRIGAQIVPPKIPETACEMFAEVLKAIGSISDLNHHPAIEYESYNQDLSVANDDAVNTLTTPTMNTSSVHSSSFYIGLDLENYANADKSQIYTGWDASTDDIYFIPSYAAQAAVINARYDAYALYDSLLVFEKGTCYVKY